MLHDESTEKVEKHFMNFKKEEAWLQKKLGEGWLLIKYADDVDMPTIYTFKPITHESQKKRVYKIDFQEFDEQEDYEDYIDMFVGSGWRSLSKKAHTKHIFYTRSAEADTDIFSEMESFQAREERKIQASFKNAMIHLGIAGLSMFIYFQFDKVFFIGVGLYAGFVMCRSMIVYVKHKKALGLMKVN